MKSNGFQTTKTDYFGFGNFRNRLRRFYTMKLVRVAEEAEILVHNHATYEIRIK